MEPIVTGNSTFDHVLAVLGALVPLFSALTSFINHRIRKTETDGGGTSPGMLATASALNLISMNIDKGIQLAKMARGLPVITTQQVQGQDNGRQE